MGLVLFIIILIMFFIFFAMKKEYVELIVALVVILILDYAFVQILSTAPILGRVAISVGGPVIELLIYAIAKLIIMGIVSK